jgi:hypothetical protein
VGAAVAVAGRLGAAGQALAASVVHRAASDAFIHGLSVGCLVAGGVALAGAVAAAFLLPAQPPTSATSHADTQPAAAGYLHPEAARSQTGAYAAASEPAVEVMP